MKFLVVDDIDAIRAILSLTISMMRPDAQVSQAANAKEAIELIKRETIDVVVSDYDMPGGNGGELFKYIRTNRPSIKFILASSHLPNELEEFRGCAELLSLLKPFTKADVAEALAKLEALE